ncbi:MAG TPA: GDP-mannose 4,6-dehydratase, partial [Candidatus Acidoferrales bacterium]|nr:GDP-mannose 4,6-dehydratase [Candidatus Acidoferrales bacterium]
MITAVVTGGAGFVGSHLCEALLDRGDKVVIVDSFEDFYAASIKRANIASALQRGARLVELDIREGRLLARVLAAESPDVVVHLAARAGVRPSLENPQLYVSINVEGTLSLLEACRQAGAGRLV